MAFLESLESSPDQEMLNGTAIAPFSYRRMYMEVELMRRCSMLALASFIVLCTVACCSVSAYYGGTPRLYEKLSNALDIRPAFRPSQALVIYSSDGVELGRGYGENRTYVTLTSIPKNLRNATVAIEDSRFYSHSGIDPKGIARAIWRDISGGKLSEGGSTITQQLVRNVCLNNQKTFQRKFQEMELALKVERSLSKNEILELYLNQIYYGSSAHGVEAAAQTYFGKSVSRLDLSESALIAGLPQKPTGYDPYKNPRAAINRRDVVLNRMAELGYISGRERDRAKRERLAIVPKVGNSGYRAPHFVNYVLSQLRSRYSVNTLRSGGLKVYTTLSYRMQRIAEKALREGIRRNSRTLNVHEGCFVCLEPETGYVRAMVGGVDPKSQYNRCTQGYGRQPGSSFKLFVYATAMEAGMTPSDKVLDAPVSYPGVGSAAWTPSNDDNKFHGMVTLEQAFVRSINIPAIRVAEHVGINNVIKMAKAAGVESELEPYLPTAIGGVKGVHPLEMASAYGTFANGGVRVEPLSITRVTDWRGNTINRYSSRSWRAIPGPVCQTMDYMLRQVVVDPNGTGHRAAIVSQARGKTGTTNNDRDAWFIGYVPGRLVAACWAGNDNNSPMHHVFGGTVCAPIWRQFMQQALPYTKAPRRKIAPAAPAAPVKRPITSPVSIKEIKKQPSLPETLPNNPNVKVN